MNFYDTCGFHTMKQGRVSSLDADQMVDILKQYEVEEST